MDTYKIAVIAGDGIGPEVLEEGVKVLKQAAECDGGFSFEFTYFPWGCQYYLETGKMMDEMCIRDSYKGELVEETEIGGRKAVIPTIAGESWIYGYGNLVLDSTDPFTEGFTIGDIWA